MRHATTHNQTTTSKPEPIRPGEVLQLSDFLNRTGLGKRAWRSVRDDCKKRGLQIVNYVGVYGYVDTDVWLEYMRTVGTQR